jgi:hypothetical protein
MRQWLGPHRASIPTSINPDVSMVLVWEQDGRNFTATRLYTGCSAPYTTPNTPRPIGQLSHLQNGMEMGQDIKPIKPIITHSFSGHARTEIRNVF